MLLRLRFPKLPRSHRLGLPVLLDLLRFVSPPSRSFFSRRLPKAHSSPLPLLYFFRRPLNQMRRKLPQLRLHQRRSSLLLLLFSYQNLFLLLSRRLSLLGRSSFRLERRRVHARWRCKGVDWKLGGFGKFSDGGELFGGLQVGWVCARWVAVSFLGSVREFEG